MHLEITIGRQFHRYEQNSCYRVIDTDSQNLYVILIIIPFFISPYSHQTFYQENNIHVITSLPEMERMLSVS